jgi:hypothetical protein
MFGVVSTEDWKGEVVIHEMTVPGALWMEVATPAGTLEVISSAEMLATTLALYQFHVAGPGPSAFGSKQIRALGQGLATYLGSITRAQYVIIIGGERSTGARPHHYPRPLVFNVKS